jgi:hypothetical protein
MFVFKVLKFIDQVRWKKEQDQLSASQVVPQPKGMAKVMPQPEEETSSFATTKPEGSKTANMAVES